MQRLRRRRHLRAPAAKKQDIYDDIDTYVHELLLSAQAERVCAVERRHQTSKLLNHMQRAVGAGSTDAIDIIQAALQSTSEKKLFKAFDLAERREVAALCCTQLRSTIPICNTYLRASAKTVAAVASASTSSAGPSANTAAAAAYASTSSGGARAKTAAAAASVSTSGRRVNAKTVAAVASASTSGRGASAKTAAAAASASTNGREVSVKIVEKSRARQQNRKRERKGRGEMR